MPEEWPRLSRRCGRRHVPTTTSPSTSCGPSSRVRLGRDDFEAMVAAAYATFDHPDVCPVVELGDLHVLELFWGPTLAFKDVALQLVGRLFDHELAARDQRATIVVATSGDTGSAAIEACVGRDRLDIVVLHPAGRVSDVQRRQMTTVDAPNVHNVAVEGTFDDCQDLVKALFADLELPRRGAPLGDELDQLGSGDGADRVLRHDGRPARSLLVRGAHRQLRQHLLRLDRRADGPADRPAGDRLEQQRHPHPVGRRRFADRAAGGAHLQPVDGHPGVVQPRTAALRAARPRR